MYKVTVFPAIQIDQKWCLYQYVRDKENKPRKIVVAENIKDQETARFMADTLTRELLRPMVRWNKMDKQNGQASD